MTGDAEQVRAMVAFWAGEAARQDGIADRLEGIVDDDRLPDVVGGDVARLAAESRAAAYRARTMQQTLAQVAVAHDVMMAAGGSDDPVARAEYVETTRMAAALMPEPEGWLDGPSLDR